MILKPPKGWTLNPDFEIGAPQRLSLLVIPVIRIMHTADRNAWVPICHGNGAYLMNINSSQCLLCDHSSPQSEVFY